MHTAGHRGTSVAARSGMAIDPGILEAVGRLVELGAELRRLDELGPEGARRQVARLVSLVPVPPVAVAVVRDVVVPGPGGPLAARVYVPEGRAPFPGLVYFHGGGWVIGDLDTHDRICRRLAREGGCVVVAVAYRLAPEHRYPAAHDDAEAATAWVAASAAALGIDPARLAVGGDSAGANLATAVCRRARERGGPPIAFQLLVAPVTQHGEETASYREHAGAPGLGASEMRFFFSCYLRGPADGREDDVSPLRAAGLAGLPPALILTAENDPLRDEGMAYADRLRAAGVPVEAVCYEGAIHLFLFLADLAPLGRRAAARAGAALRERLGGLRSTACSDTPSARIASGA
jgi:acetyl esterase